MRGRFWSGVCLALGVVAAGCHQQSPAEPAQEAAQEAQLPFLARRAGHETQLREKGPSPAMADEPGSTPVGATFVTYRSGELELGAWLGMPLGMSKGRPTPVLVYFHGDFALAQDDFEVVRPFLDAGFVVMTPMLRGENGNPGDFELLRGEVDDARAAITWVAAQPGVDARRIYVFGHSVGGGIAAMLSLFPHLPLRLSGSCGGIYVPETFVRWGESADQADLIRFDPTDPDEAELRVLGPHLEWMAHRHLAYVGSEDPWFARNASAVGERAWQLGKPFEVVEVSGDHMASLIPALTAFLAIARQDRL